jgi:hypothetical protein
MGPFNPSASREMAFRTPIFVSDIYIYAMASSLAIAVIEADMVVTGRPGQVQITGKIGERLVARAKSGQKETNVVSVRIK